MSKLKPFPLPAGTQLGAYTLVRQISCGGFGVVYEALDERQQSVAIKEYLPESLATRAQWERKPTVAPENQTLYRLGVKHFFEEGRALAQISHPSVVNVLNFFQENDTVYMVMNFLQGLTLQDFILTARQRKKSKILKESTIRSLMDDVLKGLRVVHQHDMLHLDIKPANLFITDDNKVVLIDFGASRNTLNQVHGWSQPIHTPGFAAPELYQAHGRLGPWTDFYALGAVIYACMHGRSPPQARERVVHDVLMTQAKNAKPVYSQHLLDTVRWCMDLSPENRPRSAFELQQFLADGSMLLRQPTTTKGKK